MFANLNAGPASLLGTCLALSIVIATGGSAAAQVPRLAVPLCPEGKLLPADPIEQQRIKRLVALSKVWGKVNLFHPSLAYKAIDWDAALIAAIPKVSAAGDAQAFADAVGDMLAKLGDPATKVTQIDRPRTSGRLPADPRPMGQLTPDGILVVTLTNHSDQADWVGAAKRLNDTAKLLGEAKAVVLDLRNREGVHQEALSYLIRESLLFRGLVDAAITGPGTRQRLYMGYPRQGDSGTDFYSSSFLVLDGKHFAPVPEAKSRPIVFVINAGSAVPEIGLALQEAGKATIVSEGDASDAAADLSHPLSIELEGPFAAQVRVSELVWSDGTGGFMPNVVVPVSASERGDPALDTALALARQFRVEKVGRSQLPGHGTPRIEARYADMASPSLEYRLLAAVRMHNVVQHFFPYRDIMGEDWDHVLGEFIPRLEAAADGMSYALCVTEMWTRIHDSHGFVGSAQLQQFFGPAAPPLRLGWIEGAVVIDQILDGAAVQSTALAVGDAVLSVDGEETAQRMARIGRYIPASTPQAHRRNIRGYLMGGPEGSTARLRIRNARGEERDVEIVRSMRRDSALARTPWRSGDVLRWLPGNIGYADLERLDMAQVDDLFAMFAGAKAIVFDMRGYPKGTAWHIAPRLADRTRVPAALFRQPRVWASSNDVGRDMFGDTTDFVQMLPPPRPDRPVFRGMTALLIDERTQSQAEHTGLFLKAANGTIWIGSATAGANGDITTLVVPGGITLTFTGQAVLHPDGRQLQRIGLRPDVEVHRTIAGLRAGRDEVLEAALATIEKQLAGR